MSVERLEDRTVPSTFVVQNLADSGLGSLRAAIADANLNPGADLIRFAPGARNGVIALTSANGQLLITDDLRIDGPGAHRLAVSGNYASRVFNIAGGVAATIDDLTISHGRAVGQGGGILNAGALSLSRVVLSDNQVHGVAGANPFSVVDAFGGGVFNSGTLNVRSSSFIHNQSIGADGNANSIGSSALGGAIMSGGPPSAPARATVSNSTFLANQAVGGAAVIDASRAGVGGAIANATSTLTVTHSVFHNNQAVGGLDNGFSGGFGTGVGGAIGNVARFGNANLNVSDSTFLHNRAVGGDAAPGGNAQNGAGGAIANYIFGGAFQPVTVTATATVTASTLLGNLAIGGAGATGGNGQGGGIANLNGGNLIVTHSFLALNRAIGGAGVGGDGGNGQGGGIFNGEPIPSGPPSTLALDRSLVTLNRADGGTASGGGSAGLGVGGGVYVSPGGVASADRWTFIFANFASTSDDNVFGILV